MKRALILICYLALGLEAFSQTPTTTKSIGIWGGSSYYLGDLNQRHFVPFTPGGGAYFRYNYDDRIGYRFTGSYGRIGGNDQFSDNEFNSTRNFSFTSQIYELSAVTEFNFLPFSHLNPKSSIITPYFFLGLSLFYHDPKGNTGGTRVDFMTGTSEGVTYRNLQLALPFGAGFKVMLGKFGMSFEWGIRKTWSDYLDQVSANHQAGTSNANFQRGQVFTKDWFVLAGISLFANLTPARSCPI